jgi:tetratricopeptide (TPR) repeat protein
MVSGRYELAVRAYVRTLQANPRDRAAQGYLGCALTRIGRDSLGSRFLARAGAGPWTRCTDSDELAVELRGAAETHALLALALLTRGRYEEALAESRTALRMDRNRDDAHDNAGEALLRLGKIDSAEAEFRTAIWLRPEEPEYHFDLARALAGENRLAEAATEAREAQRLDPADERYRSFSILLQVKQLVLRA